MQSLRYYSHQISHSTVRLICTAESGRESGGTGFFYDFSNGRDINGIVVITNRHVIDGASEVAIRLTRRMADKDEPNVGRTTDLRLLNFKGSWIPHPDPSVDLAAMIVGSLLELRERKGSPCYVRCLSEQSVTTETARARSAAMSDVVMVGYPRALFDEKNNMPLFRKGICATHPTLDFDGRPEFLVDMACYPGSSGSPVFLHEPKVDVHCTPVTSDALSLLGVLYAGPQFTSQGEVVMPGGPPIATRANIPMHLGFVIASSKIFDFEPILQSRVPFTKLDTRSE